MEAAGLRPATLREVAGEKVSRQIESDAKKSLEDLNKRKAELEADKRELEEKLRTVNEELDWFSKEIERVGAFQEMLTEKPEKKESGDKKLTINISTSEKTIPELVEEIRKSDIKRIESGKLTPEEMLELEGLKQALKSKKESEKKE